MSPENDMNVMVTAPTRGEFVERIKAHWHRGRETVLTIGRSLLDAKSQLSRAEFSTMVECELPFGPDTARQFMRIVSDPLLNAQATVPFLPDSAEALDQLRQLTPKEFDTGIIAGDIHPKMTVKQAKGLIGKPRPAVHVEARAPEYLKLPIIGPTDWAATLKGYRLVSKRSQLEIDERSGMQAGYTGKLEVDLRRDWNESAWDRLNGLGLVIIIVPAVDAVRLDRCACCGQAVKLESP